MPNIEGCNLDKMGSYIILQGKGVLWLVGRNVRRAREGFVLNVDDGSWQDLDYIGVRITETEEV
jgi:hypothetical protein